MSGDPFGGRPPADRSAIDTLLGEGTVVRDFVAIRQPRRGLVTTFDSRTIPTDQNPLDAYHEFLYGRTPRANESVADPSPRRDNVTTLGIPDAIANPTGPPRAGLSTLFNRQPPNGAPAPVNQGPGNAAPNTERANNAANEHEEEEEEEDDDINEDEESEIDEDVPPEYEWRPIKEDLNTPCESELAWINQQKEDSALDEKHWRDRTFFDLEDPQILPVDSGKIEWTVKPFNGTKENPNNELIMRSSSVIIGGFEWRIKLFPHGDGCQYLSVYIECVTMHSSDYAAFEPFSPQPIPFLGGIDHPTIQKRRSVAAQISVVMYNPNEPRTLVFHSDAHQFQKSSADYGWKYFTSSPRTEFHRRLHGQREAILRNDQLAFHAYIRVLNDPTGCMWEHGSSKDSYLESIALTGLRPFFSQWPQFAAALPLLHLNLFRELLYSSEPTSGAVESLQILLLKMFTRESSLQFGKSFEAPPHTHTVAYLQRFCQQLQRTYGMVEVDNLLGSMDPGTGAALGNDRLKIEGEGTLQAIVDKHPTTIYTPILLTLELERQVFDRNSRRWNKVTQKVMTDDRLTVSGQEYVLYAFATHCGDLRSNKHNVYIRPNGPKNLWYAYRDNQVTALTDKQALDPNFVPSDPWHPVSRPRKDSAQNFAVPDKTEFKDEVSYVFWYVRADAAAGVFSAPYEEFWDVPQPIKETSLVFQLTETAPEDRPYHEQEGLGTALTVPAKGSETPPWQIMDGEDVVMSEKEDDEETRGKKPRAASTSGSVSGQLMTVTRDGMGVDYYKGQMIGDKRHGHGHLILLNGDEYVGDFVNDQQSGKGKMIWASSGNTYEGEWLDGKQHGQGTMIDAVTGNIFKGGWKHGKKHGKFVLTGSVTEEDRGCCTICYENEINTAFCDCGHVVACKQCAEMVDVCPVCRQDIRSRMRIYGVRMTLE